MDAGAGGGAEGPVVAAVPPVTDPAVLREVARRREAVPWRGWDALPIALLTLLLAIPGYLLTGGMDAEAPTPLLDSGLLLVATLLWLRLVRGRGAVSRAFAMPGQRRAWHRAALGAVGVAVAAPLFDTGLHALLDLLGAQIPPIQEQLQEWIDQSPVLALLVLDVVVLTPVAEELLFRGVLFQGLARRWGVRAAAIVSSTLFGLAHVESAGLDSAFLVVSTGLFGVANVWLLRRYRSLLAPILSHVLVNAVGTAAFLAS